MADPLSGAARSRSNEAAEKGRQDTRHYAKRQFTWFRHQLGDWPRVAPQDALEVVLRAASGDPIPATSEPG